MPAVIGWPGSSPGNSHLPSAGVPVPVLGLPSAMRVCRIVPRAGGTGMSCLPSWMWTFVVVAGDLAGGERGDAGDVLAEEQDQAAGGPVGGLDAVVVQQPGRPVSQRWLSLIAVPACRWRAGEVEGLAVSLAGGPGQEVADVWPRWRRRRRASRRCRPGGTRQGGAARAEPG